MDMRGYQRYREDSLNTMTQGELLLLLYDELIKRLTQAELSLGQENYEVFEGAVGRSVDIIHYLDDTLDRQFPISANLSRLYEYFCYELSRVVSGRNAAHPLQEQLQRNRALWTRVVQADRAASGRLCGKDSFYDS